MRGQCADGEGAIAPLDVRQSDALEADQVIDVEQAFLQQDGHRGAAGHHARARTERRQEIARLVHVAGTVVGEASHWRSVRWSSALTIFSGVAGRSRMRTPTASAMAFTMAGATGTMPGSATPLAP